MIGREQEHARRSTQALFQRSVSCVSRAVVSQGRAVDRAPHFWTIDERYVPMRGRFRLECPFLHTYVPRDVSDASGRSAISSGSYFYQVRERGGPEIIAFHWHPGGGRQPDYPHVHIHRRTGSVEIDAKLHVPTGRVSLESVIRFLIAELGVMPLRADWQQVLDEGQRHFDAQRRW